MGERVKTYHVVDIVDTIQGEGARSGTRAIFLRLAFCNLWDGLEEHRDRGKGACARWCDTDFARGHAMVAKAIAQRAAELWCAPWVRCEACCKALRHLQDGYRCTLHAGSAAEPWVVITGGEPALQFDEELLEALRSPGFRIAVESNGTKRTDALTAVDHLCISPKLGSQLAVLEADELKVVVPGVRPPEASPHDDTRALAVPFPPPTRGLRMLGAGGWNEADLERLADAGSWDQLFVSPQDGPDRLANIATAIDFVRRSPRWRLSVQTHKILQIP
jgi:7-carboxy-7-deazaguanine synthase